MRGNTSEANLGNEEFDPLSDLADSPGNGFESALVLRLSVAQALRHAPQRLLLLALLLSEELEESKIAARMGVSRHKVWRLRQNLSRLLKPCLEGRRANADQI